MDFVTYTLLYRLYRLIEDYILKSAMQSSFYQSVILITRPMETKKGRAEALPLDI